MAWDTVIGLEVHVQLKTKSKLFSGASTTFGAPANTQTSFIDAGLPGVLPVLNKEAVKMAIQFGLAIEASINNYCYFERKNYFYPDLPKGYQISQFQSPIVAQGFLNIELPNKSIKKIIIDRAHLEEDAGKLLHDQHTNFTGVDLNRAGTPLLEIVTAPCLFSADEAILYLHSLHRLVRFLGICDGNMQEGSFRCDVNISLKPQGSAQLGTRVELKNLNSFRFIEKAILFEQARQQDLLENGQLVQQETRLYCPNTNTTQLMRSKENDNDYRYFPDPDLLPIKISNNELAEIRQTMPTLPDQIELKLRENNCLHSDEIHFLLSSPAIYHYFAELTLISQADHKTIINWLRGNYLAALHEANLSFDNSPVSAKALAPLLNYLADQTISHQAAKQIFKELWKNEKTVDELIERNNGTRLSDINLEQLTENIIQKYPQQIAEYRAGKEKLLGFFVGQVLKETKGQANPNSISLLIQNYIKQTP